MLRDRPELMEQLLQMPDGLQPLGGAILAEEYAQAFGRDFRHERLTRAWTEVMGARPAGTRR